MKKIATTQAISPISGVAPPINKQFGQPDGNPRGDGVNKEKLAARRDLQRLLNEIIEMSDDKLKDFYDDKCQPRIVQIFALALHRGRMEDAMTIWHEVFGFPKQRVETLSLNPPKILKDLTEDLRGEEDGVCEDDSV